jgi:hypothetical protein
VFVTPTLIACCTCGNARSAVRVVIKRLYYGTARVRHQLGRTEAIGVDVAVQELGARVAAHFGRPQWPGSAFLLARADKALTLRLHAPMRNVDCRIAQSHAIVET